MPAIGNTYLDLLDVYKARDPDGGIAPVIEMLMELNPMLEDMIVEECNNGTTHRHMVRTGLPDVAWGKLYKGIPNSKGTREQVDDVTGFVEGRSTVDMRLMDLAGAAGAALRLQEAQGFLESIAQEMQETLVYGDDATAPNEFMGLAPRFNSLAAINGNQIIDAKFTTPTSGAMTSIWMVMWGQHCTTTLYPKGTQAGVKREDHGKQRVTDSAGDAYYAMEETFTQHCGLALKDWRYTVRIANIEASRLISAPDDIDGNGNDLYHFLRRAYYQHEGRRHPKAGNNVIYCSKDVLEALDALGTNAGSTDNYVRLRRDEVEGKEVLKYRTHTLRECDAVVHTETQVT